MKRQLQNQLDATGRSPHQDQSTLVIQTAASPSKNTVLAIKIVLVLIILLLLPKLVEAKRRRRNRSSSRVELRLLRKECLDPSRTAKCAHSSALPEENMNCFLRCLSQVCYDQIYAASPLEDGEVDYDRYKQFERCLKGDIKNRNIPGKRKI